MMTYNVRIEDRGNGLPQVGDYCGGKDGHLYRITQRGRLNTGARAGWADWCMGEAQRMPWESVDEDAEHSAEVWEVWE